MNLSTNILQHYIKRYRQIRLHNIAILSKIYTYMHTYIHTARPLSAANYRSWTGTLISC
jgi:hypothetical protein